MIDISYTIAFIFFEDNLLLLQRNKYPWIGKWNGVGGKIEKNETPEESILREIFEETGIKTIDKKEVIYKGIVSWPHKQIKNKKGGMHTFIMRIKNPNYYFPSEKQTREGVLAWKKIEWVMNKDNQELARNIPYFLPDMLETKKNKEYYFSFESENIKGYKILPLNR